ncbi:hypothetical protein BHM03_00027855 [Ensete ventricosum]|nr:hypothetical protein BHM03_00027855 [Ensete ventricosum]
MHNSVTATSDRHILLKGHCLYCLAYHNTTFSNNSSRALLFRNRCLCPATLYLSFSLILLSSLTTTTIAFFSPPTLKIVMQPCPQQPWVTTASTVPTLTLLLFRPCCASSSSTLVVASIINASISFAIVAAPILMMLLPFTIALVIPYTDMLPSSLRQQPSLLNRSTSSPQSLPSSSFAGYTNVAPFPLSIIASTILQHHHTTALLTTGIIAATQSRIKLMPLTRHQK